MQRINTQAKYEYKVVSISSLDKRGSIASILTELGQEGWRVIHTDPPNLEVSGWWFVMERVERFVPEPSGLADDVIFVGKWHIGRRTLEQLMDFCSREGVFDRFQDGKFNFASRPVPKPDPSAYHTLPMVLNVNSSPIRAAARYVVDSIPDGLTLLVNDLQVKKGFEVVPGEELRVIGISSTGDRYVRFKPVK